MRAASSCSYLPSVAQLSTISLSNSSQSSMVSRPSMMTGWGDMMPCLRALRLEAALPRLVLGPPRRESATVPLQGAQPCAPTWACDREFVLQKRLFSVYAHAHLPRMDDLLCQA